MTTVPQPRKPGSGFAYDDPSTPSELTADCRAAEARLALPDAADSPVAPAWVDRVARAAVRPAPSIRFEDLPREVAKREVDPTAAARRIAVALDL
jgi:hypothetical protein